MEMIALMMLKCVQTYIQQVPNECNLLQPLLCSFCCPREVRMQRYHKRGQACAPQHGPWGSSWLFLGTHQFWSPVPKEPPRAAEALEETAQQGATSSRASWCKHLGWTTFFFCHWFIWELIWYIEIPPTPTFASLCKHLNIVKVAVNHSCLLIYQLFVKCPTGTEVHNPTSVTSLRPFYQSESKHAQAHLPFFFFFKDPSFNQFVVLPSLQWVQKQMLSINRLIYPNSGWFFT